MSAHPLPPEPSGASQTTLVVDAMAPKEPPTPAPAPPPRSPVGHLFAGVGLAIGRPRVLLFLVLLSVLSALPIAIGFSASAGDTFGTLAMPAASEEADFLTTAPKWVFDDWARASRGALDGLTHTLAPLLLLASVLGLLVSGGWMSMGLRGSGQHGLLAFLRGGGEHFFPFLRTWILGLALAAGVTWVFFATPGEAVLAQLLPDGDFAQADSESTARWIEHGREVLYVIVLLFVEVVLDLARASLAATRGCSALLAVLRGGVYLLMEPVRVSLLLFLGFALEVAWIAGVLAITQELALPLWPLVLLVPLGRVAFRGARLAGLATMYAESRVPDADRHGEFAAGRAARGGGIP